MIQQPKGILVKRFVAIWRKKKIIRFQVLLQFEESITEEDYLEIRAILFKDDWFTKNVRIVQHYLPIDKKRLFLIFAPMEKIRSTSLKAQILSVAFGMYKIGPIYLHKVDIHCLEDKYNIHGI